MARSVGEARAAIRNVLGRSGLSMRALSGAMGRDADYIAAFLDPRRPNRARPTPDDLVAASDATGIALVELLDAVWGIPPDRLADELGASGGGRLAETLARLSTAERREVIDFAKFLAARHDTPAPMSHRRSGRRRPPHGEGEDGA
jgi:hypothetical protein